MTQKKSAIADEIRLFTWRYLLGGAKQRIDRSADCIILELKVDHTADEALQQIRDRQYALKFEKKIGGAPQYTGRVLGVGIAYDKKTKEHTCKIEVLRGALAAYCR